MCHVRQNGVANGYVNQRLQVAAFTALSGTKA